MTILLHGRRLCLDQGVGYQVFVIANTIFETDLAAVVICAKVLTHNLYVWFYAITWHLQGVQHGFA